MSVSLQDVCKTYEDGVNRVEAVRGVSLTIQQGEFAVVTGPSGSGKSTLLNLIGCIDKPTSGSITIASIDITGASESALNGLRARHIGYIFQSFNLIPVLSALENVEYSLRKSALTQLEQRKAAQDTLAAVGLSDMLHKRPNQLSGGQRQRVAIARALAKRPTIVLADEPTANLDTRTGASVLELMHELQRSQGSSFIFSTHDPALIGHADTLFTIRDGRLESAPASA